MAWTLRGGWRLSILVQLIPRCAQLLPAAAHSPRGPPSAPVHTKISSLCRGLGSSGSTVRAGDAPASRISGCFTPRCPRPSRAFSRRTAAEQLGGRDTLLGRIIFKKGLVTFPITAAGSACRKLKRRGKLFIQRYLAGQEDAIAQATVTTQARQVTAEP